MQASNPGKTMTVAVILTASSASPSAGTILPAYPIQGQHILDRQPADAFIPPSAAMLVLDSFAPPIDYQRRNQFNHERKDVA